MCSVSMIGDFYTDKWQPTWPSILTSPEVNRYEFEQLKKEVEDMKELLRRAKDYDERNGEPHCEMDEKVVLLKKIAEHVGVDLSEIFK